MRKYLMYLLLFFMSCETSDDIFVEGGISLNIANFTENSYEKATLFIGAIKDSDFIVTDSIVSVGVIKGKIKQENYRLTELTVGTFGWTPKLSNIEDVSKEAAFLLTLENGPQLFFNSFKFPKPKLEGKSLFVNIISNKLSTPDKDPIEKMTFNIIK